MPGRVCERPQACRGRTRQVSSPASTWPAGPVTSSPAVSTSTSAATSHVRRVSAAAIAAPVASAGSPHFIGNAFSISRTDNTLTVSGKEAGLGDEAQIHVVLSATAECINPGGITRRPRQDQRVRPGRLPRPERQGRLHADGHGDVPARVRPPMTVRFSNVTVTDTTNDLTKSFAGTF